MPKDNRHSTYSDTEILNLIEDFLVNHFEVDDRQDMPKGPAFELLEHIEALVDLRGGNSQQRDPAVSAQKPRPAQDDARS